LHPAISAALKPQQSGATDEFQGVYLLLAILPVK
jgi:hypothetical protein